MARKLQFLTAQSLVGAINANRDEKLMLQSGLTGSSGGKSLGLNRTLQPVRVPFPLDFAFKLSSAEFKQLRSQSVLSDIPKGARVKAFSRRIYISK